MQVSMRLLFLVFTYSVIQIALMSSFVRGQATLVAGGFHFTLLVVALNVACLSSNQQHRTVAIGFLLPGLVTYIPFLVFAFDEFMLGVERIESIYRRRISSTVGYYLLGIQLLSFSFSAGVWYSLQWRRPKVDEVAADSQPL